MEDKTELLKHKMVLYLADNQMNWFMSALDLAHKGKFFVCPYPVTFETTTTITKNYFKKIIQESKKNRDSSNKNKEQKTGFWIPAIKYQDNLIVDEEVVSLSDGYSEFFV